LALEKKESRAGIEGGMAVMGIVDALQKIYGMDEVRLSPGELKAFRDKTQGCTRGGPMRLGSIWSVTPKESSKALDRR
jgi:hypothetical protein